MGVKVRRFQRRNKQPFILPLEAILGTFNALEWVLIALIFAWSGFVRTGLGFGGAALGLPLMLLIRPDPLFWLPIVGSHLLFFTVITLLRRLSNVAWRYLGWSLKVMIIPKLIGVLGLVVLPQIYMVIIIYLIIFAFALSNIFHYVVTTEKPWAERLLLILGGYASGTSLVGAPLIVAAYSQRVDKRQLRNTLFVLWIILVCIKMSALAALDVPLQWQYSLLLAPAAGVGHVLGLHAHEKLVSGTDFQFRRILGLGLAAISVFGLLNALREHILG